MLALAAALNLPVMVSAALVLTTLTLTTGAFHEDGLADTFDGLFGGHDKERRLEIMKDSRIGTFGGCALMLAFLLRFSLLIALIEEGGLAATLGALAIAAIWSRTLGIHVLAVEKPARAYGALATVGQPTVRTAQIALGLAGGLCLAAALAVGLPMAGLMLGLAPRRLHRARHGRDSAPLDRRPDGRYRRSSAAAWRDRRDARPRSRAHLKGQESPDVDPARHLQPLHQGLRD